MKNTSYKLISCQNSWKVNSVVHRQMFCTGSQWPPTSLQLIGHIAYTPSKSQLITDMQFFFGQCPKEAAWSGTMQQCRIVVGACSSLQITFPLSGLLTGRAVKRPTLCSLCLNLMMRLTS